MRDISQKQPTHDLLLTTKLYMPPVASHLISRPRLLERLSAGMQRKLTLLSAPAGYGKTMLLVAWLRSSSMPVAWVSLDEGDNDSVRFWEYVCTALNQLYPVNNEHVSSLLHSSQPLPVDYLLTTLINTLASASQDFVLVLDDYHAITTSAIHQGIAFLLDHLPPRMHLVLITRADPPFSLSRLRAGGQLMEVRAADLRFTQEEATAFLNGTMGLRLTPSDVATVEARTEGWIAGLQLLALSLQGREDATSFIATLSGSHRYILDYLTDEVIQQQPEPIQTFLLYTSLLDRLTASLCDALTQEQNSQSILEFLERANLFLVPLDDEHKWYRYHALFADVLRLRLQQAHRELVPVLHRRASVWYLQHGEREEALRHALQAHDWQNAADLLEQMALPVLWLRGELTSVRHWFESFSPEVLRSRPRLCLAYAMILLLSDSRSAVASWLRDAEAALSSPNLSAETSTTASSQGEELPGQITAVQALLAAFQEESTNALAWCQKAKERMVEGDGFSQIIIAYAQAMAQRARNEVAAACQSYAEISQVMQSVGNTFVTMTASYALARLLKIRGRLHEAFHLVQQLVQLAMGPDGRYLPVACYALGVMGDLLREWNRLEEALQTLSESITLGEQAGNTDFLLDGYLMLMNLHLARGELEAARAAFSKLESLMLDVHDPHLLRHLEIQRARLALARGDNATASSWARRCGPRIDAETLSNPISEFEQRMVTRVLLAEKRPDEALELLAPLLHAAESTERWEHVIEVLVLQAQAFHMRNDIRKALSTLARAVQLAEQESYMRLFVDEGAAMAALLVSLRATRTQATRYIDSLLAAFHDRAGKDVSLPSGAAQQEQVQPLVEPLSGRELEVLRLLAQGASTTEIAAQLVIANNTVKRHVSSILGKLGVSNRIHAVAQARELGLL